MKAKYIPIHTVYEELPTYVTDFGDIVIHDVNDEYFCITDKQEIAELIVNSCNNRDKLVEALEICKRDIELCMTEDIVDLRPTINIIIEALAEAKEE